MSKLKPVCYVGMSLHPRAREALAARFDIIEDEAELGRASAALVYTVPERWVSDKAAQGLHFIGCHATEPGSRRWIYDCGFVLILAKSLWRTVAEHTLALMMAATRNIARADEAIRCGQWRNHHDLKVRFSGLDFQGKTVGIWGMGKIGAELCDMLRGFRMCILYNDIARRPDEWEASMGATYAPLLDMLAQSDYLCVLLPLNDETTGLMGAEEFATMKRGCVLVNTARAGIIDEGAFRTALTDGTVGAAALDVFWNEGAPQPDYLTSAENVVLSPHLGGSTYECDMVLVNGISMRG
ncbi:MAG: hypothetical protein FWH01_15315 [Oscillospiraceae bacterium]|nr:hypothetical protein [Oscillospiraceae bacterium]